MKSISSPWNKSTGNMENTKFSGSYRWRQICKIPGECPLADTHTPTTTQMSERRLGEIVISDCQGFLPGQKCPGDHKTYGHNVQNKMTFIHLFVPIVPPSGSETLWSFPSPPHSGPPWWITCLSAYQSHWVGLEIYLYIRNIYSLFWALATRSW